jgi:HAD superfamily hydrolase (TIGR01549 family)
VDDVASCERLGPEFESGYAWQPLLRDFDEYSVDFSVSVDGVSSPLGIRRRIRSSGGFAVLCEPTAPSHVTEVAANAARRLAVLGARGVLNFQIMRVGEECWISDLNARVGTSLPLSLVAGSNPVAFLFEEQDRSPPATTSYRRTVRTLVEHAVPMLDLASVRGVVFDLDDTLFDQKDWIFRKLGMTWDVERAILPDRTTFLRMALQIVEEGNRSRLFDAIATELSLSDADRVRLIETYRTARPAGCRLYDDVGPTLMQLRKLGYALGLVTDNPPASQRQKLDVAGLSGCFDAVLLTGEMNKAKPHPDVFSQIGQLLSIEPERLIMVGDNLFRDIHGSLDAGFRHAFHIQRPGGFFNFSHALCADVTSMIRVHSISRLDELLWHLAGMALGHGKP